MKKSQQVYSVDEVAALLGIGRNGAYESVRSGQIPSIRIGKRILVPKAAFDRMLARDVAGDGAGREMDSDGAGHNPAEKKTEPVAA